MGGQCNLHIKVKAIISKGLGTKLAFLFINICWVHKAYKPILDAFPVDILLVHLTSLLQTVWIQIRLLS